MGLVPLAIVLAAASAAGAGDCGSWTLDGYRLGMRGDELLAVRSVTLHVEGQAQASEPGKLHGVLVLDAMNRLVKWDVVYEAKDAEPLRAEMRARFGAPAADATGAVFDDGHDVLRQRQTLWRSPACDAAIVVYENIDSGGGAGHAVHATLGRASAVKVGFPGR
ncbi:MAG TPA: hypothetical protein VFB67_00865 [Candidatus Polarisedimenticolaceae bacterium]|nr:hypothetical protein [Candidatus Polarisedimenticolaceae bacterium]